ncbi:hypothetical protein HpBT125_13590 [Helicobacter pylori]
MEKTETTIFVDWENLLTDLMAIQKNPKTDKRFKEPDSSFNNPEQLLALIRSFLEPEEELKRIYFYASEPYYQAILHQTRRVYFAVQQGYRFCACVRSRLGEGL